MKTYLLAATGCIWALSSVAQAQDPGYREPERRRAPASAAAAAPGTAEIITDDSNLSAGRINSMANLDDKRALGIGDILSVRIVEDKDRVLSLRVQDSGDIQAPYIGLVPVLGRTCKQVAMYMKSQLEGAYFQKATVIVAVERIAPVRRVNPVDEMGYFTVYGQVARQGKYELTPSEDLTVSQAVLRAGGFAQFAKVKKVLVIRKTSSGNKNIVVNLERIMTRGDLQYDIPIRDSDVIIVKEKLINF